MSQAPNVRIPLVYLDPARAGEITREWLPYITMAANAAAAGDVTVLADAVAAMQTLLNALQSQVSDIAANQATSGTAVIDFGPFPGSSDAQTTISAPDITAASVPDAWIVAAASTDHSADEHAVETIQVSAGNVVPGATMTIYGANTSLGDTRIYGKWNVGWSYT